jgi:hypothetical protein
MVGDHRVLFAWGFDRVCSFHLPFLEGNAVNPIRCIALQLVLHAERVPHSVKKSAP